MKIKVNEVNPYVAKQYPYTHRIEFEYLLDYVTVLDWVNENCVRACGISQTQSMYLNQKDTEWLLLRWL